MDHSNLLVVNAKCLAVCKTPNSSQLIHQYNIFISNVQINRIQISVKHLVIHWVLPSLLESKVHDSTKDFEEVLYDIVRGVVLGGNRQVEFVPLLLDH